MPQKGEYSSKYSFHVSNVVFDMGGQPMGQSHSSLTTTGIEGAQPKIFTAERVNPISQGILESDSSGRSFRKPPSEPRNPLEPHYNLPPVVQQPVDPPKFIRDSFNVTDIAGTQPKHLSGAPNRNSRSLDASDIEGSKPSRAQKFASSETRTATLDVFDIIGPKSELHPQRNAPAPPGELTEVAKVGAIQSQEWKHQLYHCKREQAEAAAQRRNAAQAVIQNLHPAEASTLVTKLGAEFKAMDRDHSGKLRPSEVCCALRNSGINLAEADIKTVGEGLAHEKDPGALVDYQTIIKSLYKHSSASTPKPNWLAAQQRRLKTEVAVALNQQPQATAAAQELEPFSGGDASQKKGGKKVQGLAKPLETHGDAYWFAINAGGEGARPPSDVKGGRRSDPHSAIPIETYWFADEGTTDQSHKETAAWLPTKDATFVNALMKEKGAQKSNKYGTPTSTRPTSAAGKSARGAPAHVAPLKPIKKRVESKLERLEAADVATLRNLD